MPTEMTMKLPELKIRLLAAAFLLMLTVAVAGCDFFDDNDGDGITLWQTLSSYDKIGTITTEGISNFYPSEADPFLAYDVTAYRLVYHTETPGGESQLASGVVLVPQRQNPATMVSLHRSTIFHETEAPSNVNIEVPDNRNTAWSNLGVLFGSAGFITTMPDLLGWGSSSEMLHPYMVAESDEVVGFDMLLATKEMLEAEEIGWNGNLYLSGYSQGASSMMAVLKAIESDPQERFSISKASAGGGAYNLEELAVTILELDELAFSPFYAFFLKAYWNTYFPIDPLSRYFNGPYDNIIVSEQLFRGGLFGNEIEERLTSQTGLLIRNTFRQQYISGGEPQFREVLMDNDLSNFRVESALRLYHGENDEIIPHQEALNSFNNLVNAGSENVTFISVEDQSHNGAAVTYFSETLGWFLGQQ
jgi:hypothetical protein